MKWLLVVLLLLTCIGCAQEEPEVNAPPPDVDPYGWVPPPTDEQKKSYGEEPEPSLRQVAPELFKD